MPFLCKHFTTPLSVKVVALEWIQRFCEGVIATYENSNIKTHLYEAFEYFGVFLGIWFSQCWKRHWTGNQK